MIKARWLLMIMALMLAGCATHPTPDTLPQAWLKPGVRVRLPSPQLNEKLEQQQLLTGTVDGKQQSLLVLLNANGKTLQLAGLSPLGIRLFKVDYDAAGIHTEQTIKISQLPPANQVLADIMLSYWPVDRWQPLLPTGWRLVDNGMTRTLIDDAGQPVTQIDYQNQGGKRQPIAITQHVFHYHIAIQNVGDGA
ncbi:DUF3261 domain-containing protein [Rouxiella badensis]|jgi:uncharacterized protein YcfL|uniref:DUF3261 domain-containing protein n=1 Tax=Rouxiella badensis TaxID=1646377 RepID=A0A1X0WCS7_9GAMM|nr:DUF3261 domain-containing protein [Rouxiella badensis]MCC3703910.1 DUF3261 domain-containing protein [Rouxiella badensis]MCC3718931.1 DUF3261 domain-containing protein [Rouxiella badensis]MCC3728985.1 DUF3261 domain-containing protein [Rouxiella badensis]MCC3733518.1 DUF3261 domain-containing protein [Rouxiella badensis]MCC3740536.1 DUF3261 domain-containing protein [Rouxiella badensis]